MKKFVFFITELLVQHISIVEKIKIGHTFNAACLYMNSSNPLFGNSCYNMSVVLVVVCKAGSQNLWGVFVAVMNLFLCHYISWGLVCPPGDCRVISGPSGEVGPPGLPGLEGIPGNIL